MKKKDNSRTQSPVVSFPQKPKVQSNNVVVKRGLVTKKK